MRNWFQNLLFQIQLLCHYVAGRGLLLVWDLSAPAATPAHAMVLEGVPTCVVGLYKLNPVDTWLESAWFQPLKQTYKVKNWFLFSKFALKL